MVAASSIHDCQNLTSPLVEWLEWHLSIVTFLSWYFGLSLIICEFTVRFVEYVMEVILKIAFSLLWFVSFLWCQLLLVVFLTCICLNVCSEATWHGRRNCRLTLHYENGFTLTSNETIFENGGPAVDMLSGRKSGSHTILWHYPFEKLQLSWDDGHHLLWLDFGEDGEQVSYE